MTPLVLALILALAPATTGGAGASERVAHATPPVAHKLHVSYGQAAVENDVVMLRVRLFRDDLEGALRRQSGRADLNLTPGPETDGAFLAYLRDHLTMSVDGATLPVRIVSSGRDELDREPVVWYVLQFDAPGTVTRFRVRNTLLLEMFDDQRNIVKFVHFPDQTQKTYSFGEGEEEFDVSF